MIRILPIILLIVLILGGLAYLRYNSNKQVTDTQSVEKEEQGLIEVPSTLPNLSTEDKVKDLEKLSEKLVTEVNSLKTSSPKSTNTTDVKIASLETAIAELKLKIAALEKTTPTTTTSSSGSSVYIPLGSGGQWSNSEWTILPEYEVSLDPSNFPNYTGMTLDVVFRLDDPTGTGSVRLYNVTDSTATSLQIDTTSSSFASKSTASFKLATGAKTYRLQIKSSGGKNLIIQTARIKVSF